MRRGQGMEEVLLEEMTRRGSEQKVKRMNK